MKMNAFPVLIEFWNKKKVRWGTIWAMRWMWQQYLPKFPQNISSDPRRMRWGIAMMLVLVRSSKILTIHGLKNYLKQTSSRQVRLQAQNE